jgi:hypothetical protein
VVNNEVLKTQLLRLADGATRLAGEVARNGELAPLVLASGLVEAAKLEGRLEKLARTLAAGDARD